MRLKPLPRSGAKPKKIKDQAPSTEAACMTWLAICPVGSVPLVESFLEMTVTPLVPAGAVTPMKPSIWVWVKITPPGYRRF